MLWEWGQRRYKMKHMLLFFFFSLLKGTGSNKSASCRGVIDTWGDSLPCSHIKLLSIREKVTREIRATWISSELNLHISMRQCFRPDTAIYFLWLNALQHQPHHEVWCPAICFNTKTQTLSTLAGSRWGGQWLLGRIVVTTLTFLVLGRVEPIRRQHMKW